MISEVVFEAVEHIDRYLNHPTFARTYTGARRTRLVMVRTAMDELRQELDTPPKGNGGGKR